MKKGIFKVVYIIVVAIITLAILIYIISGIIRKANILGMVFIAIFYGLGCTAGVLFLLINVFGFIKFRNKYFLIISFLSMIWVGISMLLWLTHGFVI
jgi:hypothetical protein